MISFFSAWCGWGAWACNAGGQGGLARAYGASDADAFRIGAKAGATTAMFQAAGEYGKANYAQYGDYGYYGAHAVAGCVSSAANGGNCGSGAAAAVFGKWATIEIGGTPGVWDTGQFAATVVAGGVGSVIGGGKFENGAKTAAFGYLFNHCSSVAGGCWRALKDSASMTFDWATGTGLKDRTFGPGTIQVIDMMDAPGVNGARNLFYQKNASAIADGNFGDLSSVTNYGAGFGVSGLLTTSSPTQQFVGSYGVSVFSINGGQDLMFSVTNNSSFKSFGYGVTPAWERSTFAPAGNMRQTYWWTEPRR